MSQHAEMSPSRLPRIILCPGSVELCKSVPRQPTSVFAAEGTMLHSHAEQVLDMWPNDPEIQYESIDHQAAVTDAVDYVKSFVDLQAPGAQLFTEVKVRMAQHEEVYGTCDVGAVTPTAIHIFDYKFGRGIPVRVFNNPQMLAYTDGFIHLLSIVHPEVHAEIVSGARPVFMHIVQPRINNYDCVQVFPQDLVNFNVLITRTLALVRGANPPFVPGEEQCRWCDAGGVCKVRIDQASLHAQAALLAYADMQENKASKEELVQILSTKAEVTKAFDAIEKAVFLELTKGQEVPGFKLIRGRSNRTWSPGTTVDSLTTAIPELDDIFDQLVETKLRGPAQIEKLVPKDKRDTLAKFIVKPEGALTIAAESHPSEAVMPNDPTTVFKDLIE